MKSLVLSSLLLLSLSSCLVMKVYESPERTATVSSKPSKVHHAMIPSGETIEFGKQGSKEILFFGKDVSPKKVFFKSDSLLSEETIWIDKDSEHPIFIIKTEEDKPLFVIDGKVETSSVAIKKIDVDAIESIHVLKGASAIKKYGQKGSLGVIEIITK